MNFFFCIFPLFISLSFGFGYYKTKNHSIFGNKIKNYKMITNDYFGYPCNTEYGGESEENPLYIVIWKEFEKTRNLIREMENQGLKTIFIPESEYDTILLTTEEMPLVFKNELLLESWMDIYAEMYPM
jgi:hypothetical protein